MPAPPTTPSALDMLTTDPPSRIRGSTYFMPRNTPRILTAKTRSKSSSGNSTIGRTGVWMPALLTKPSTLPEFEGSGGVAAHLFRIAHVGDEGLKRAGTGHLRNKACQPGFVGSDGQNICALRDQALGDGGAKVACSASNDDILA